MLVTLPIQGLVRQRHNQVDLHHLGHLQLGLTTIVQEDHLVMLALVGRLLEVVRLEAVAEVAHLEEIIKS